MSFTAHGYYSCRSTDHDRQNNLLLLCTVVYLTCVNSFMGDDMSYFDSMVSYNLENTENKSEYCKRTDVLDDLGLHNAVSGLHSMITLRC